MCFRSFIGCLLLLSSITYGADWPQWRGPNGNGIAIDAASDSGRMPPLHFGENKNLIWKTSIPGRGHASPVVVDNRVYLATAELDRQTQSLVSIEGTTGEIIWKRPVLANGTWPAIHKKNTHASSTIACDGERVFATFYSQAQIWIVALSVEGAPLWKVSLAAFQPQYLFGYAASPLIFQDLVIATAESEAETSLIGIDRKSGDEVWRARRPTNSSYSSPALLQVGGRTQLCISGGREVRAYDPGTGKELWRAPAAAKHTAGTVTGAGDFVIASGGYPQSETTCIHADGSGRVAWTNKQKCYEQSLLIHDGYVYAVTDGGVAYCWELKTGAERWRKRLRGPVSSSPVLVGNRIYVSNERGQGFVFAATPDRYQELARNQLGTDAFPTPTFLGGRIYARVGFGEGTERQEVLYCFGEK